MHVRELAAANTKEVFDWIKVWRVGQFSVIQGLELELFGPSK